MIKILGNLLLYENIHTGAKSIISLRIREPFIMTSVYKYLTSKSVYDVLL